MFRPLQPAACALSICTAWGGLWGGNSSLKGGAGKQQGYPTSSEPLSQKGFGSLERPSLSWSSLTQPFEHCSLHTAWVLAKLSFRVNGHSKQELRQPLPAPSPLQQGQRPHPSSTGVQWPHPINKIMKTNVMRQWPVTPK